MRVRSLQLELSPLPSRHDCWEIAIARACSERYPEAQLLRWAITAVVDTETALVEVVFTAWESPTEQS